MSHSLWEAPRWLISENPRFSSHVHLTAGEGSTMGKRPRFNHNGTVSYPSETPSTRKARQPHAQALGMTGEEAGGRPDPAGEAAPHRRPASTRRHCSDGSSVLSPPALPGPMAAVVKDSFLEEWRELTNGVLRKRQPHFVDV